MKIGDTKITSSQDLMSQIFKELIPYKNTVAEAVSNIEDDDRKGIYINLAPLHRFSSVFQHCML